MTEVARYFANVDQMATSSVAQAVKKMLKVGARARFSTNDFNAVPFSEKTWIGSGAGPWINFSSFSLGPFSIPEKVVHEFGHVLELVHPATRAKGMVGNEMLAHIFEAGALQGDFMTRLTHSLDGSGRSRMRTDINQQDYKTLLEGMDEAFELID